MVRKRIVLIVGPLLLVLLGGVVSIGFTGAQPPTPPAIPAVPAEPFQPRPLVGAPLEEVAQQAVAFTHARYPVLNGDVKVRLVRPVTTADLPSLGLPWVGFSSQEPELVLVILQGDFDVRGMPGRGRSNPDTSHLRVGFIGYLIDLRAGVPTVMMTSNGQLFRIALNDPTLPADLPKVPSQPRPTPSGPRPTYSHPPGVPPTVAPDKRAPYGSVAPPIVTPVSATR